jgi:threonine dehydrogenase-like Zn-dependent dehydrogenase
MKAVRCHEAGRVHVTEVPEPSGDGIDVRVRAAGICGSDLHLLASGLPLPGTLGHELAGTLADGTPVAIEPLAPCGTCTACRSGRYNLCSEGPAMIFGIGRDGGMAEKVRVPQSALVPLPAGVDVSNACLVEPLAVAIHGMRRARVRPGERVAVVGGGTIGLVAVAAARAAGAEADLVARHDVQRAAGDRLGAGLVTDDRGYDVVVDAVGTSEAVERAIALAAPGGRLILLGSYWDGMRVPGFALCIKEIDVFPASLYAHEGGNRDVDAAAALLAREPEIPRAIITHRFPLEAAEEAFRVAADRKAGAIKVVLEP